MQLITPKLVATLDKCKVSDRDAVRILSATAEALGHDVTNIVINRNSICRCRKRLRSEIAGNIFDKFKEQSLPFVTVHWDGKILPNVTGVEHLDRLPVIITSGVIEQMLGVPAITSGKGQYQADAVFEALQKWNITDRVQAFCFDTTASNTGRFQGACVLLEQKLERDILYLPCRHHIYEIILKTVFDNIVGQSFGPGILIFKDFREEWATMDKLKFTPGISDEYVKEKLSNITDLLDFSMKCLKEQQLREDYRELLELMVIFLGGIPPRGISFRMPGAFHHARWMAKGIYCLKIYLFRNQFLIAKKGIERIRDVCIFVVYLYVKAWIHSPLAIEAPLQDLKFLNDLYLYKGINEQISQLALLKFCNHLWYLSPEPAALAFFDENVSDETKLQMVEAVKTTDISEENVKKVSVHPKNLDEYLGRSIDYFITQKSQRFFERFSINNDFLNMHPSEWKNNENYKNGLKIASGLKVVNDVAERGVQLMEEYNKILSKNEDDKQFILQIVSDYRKLYPDVNKSTLLVPFPS